MTHPHTKALAEFNKLLDAFARACAFDSAEGRVHAAQQVENAYKAALALPQEQAPGAEPVELTDEQIDGLFEYQRDPVQVGQKPYVCLDREGFREIARCIVAMSTPSSPGAAEAGEAVAGDWEGAEEWMPLAWELCANECGEEACTELVWEGGPIPEPWGDRWLKYEDQAREMIAMVRKHVPSLAATHPKAEAEARPVGALDLQSDAPLPMPAMPAAPKDHDWRPTAAPREVAGWKWMPPEATPEMIAAVEDRSDRLWSTGAVYRAMFSAAPQEGTT